MTLSSSAVGITLSGPSTFPARFAQAFEVVLEYRLVSEPGRCAHGLLAAKPWRKQEKLGQRLARLLEPAELTQCAGKAAPTRRKLRPALHGELRAFGRLGIVARQNVQTGERRNPGMQQHIVGAEADRHFDGPNSRLRLATKVVRDTQAGVSERIARVEFDRLAGDDNSFVELATSATDP